MPTVLTYTRIRPEPNDKSGTEWMANNRHNVEVDDSHDHDGINSKKITIESFDKTLQTLVSGSWVAVGNGMHYQDVTMSVGSYDDAFMRFWIVGGTYDGTEAPFETLKLGAGQFRIYSNDNTIGVIVKYV